MQSYNRPICTYKTIHNTAVLKKEATFNTDFGLCDSNLTHQNAFRSCDGTFARKAIKCNVENTATAKSNYYSLFQKFVSFVVMP